MAIDIVGNQKTIQTIVDESAKKTQDRKTGDLGKDDFLNLLVTQLRYQDPLKPVDDKEFIGQMAQFSGLEQMQNLNTSFSSVRGYSMIGKVVTASIKDNNGTATRAVQGEVTSVKVNAGKTYVVVNNEDISIDAVTEVTSTEIEKKTSSSIAGYTNLIGFDAKGYVYDSKTTQVVPVKGKVAEIVKGISENYAVMDDVTASISEIAGEKLTTDPNFTKDYLDLHKGKEITVMTLDAATGNKAPLTGVLKDVQIDSLGNIKGTFDGVFVPVDSVANIWKGL